MTRPHIDHSLDSDGDGDRPVCAGSEDPDLWFDPDRADLARSLCRECPVRVACLADAVRRGEEWGVWGGRLFEPSNEPVARPIAVEPDAAASPVAASSGVVVVPLRPATPHGPSEAALRARPRVAAALALLCAERAAGAGGPEAA